MDATFIGLLQSQIEALQKSESNPDNNITILRTIKLLLDKMDLSSETLSQYDELTRRSLFAAYGKVGKQVCAFYDNNKPYLDPAALNGSIGKKLTETTEQIEAITTALNELTTKEAKLLSQKEELMAINATYRALQEKISELKAIRETVSDESIAAAEQENEQIEADIERGKERQAIVTAKNEQLKKLLSEVTETQSKVNAEQQQIETNITAIIDKHHDELKAIYDDNGKMLDNIKADIERYVHEFESLKVAIREYTQNREFYALWLGENSTIVQTMREQNLGSINQFVDAINKAKFKAERELNAYDAVIKNIITVEEEARKAIEKKQNKTP